MVDTRALRADLETVYKDHGLELIKSNLEVKTSRNGTAVVESTTRAVEPGGESDG